MASWFSGHWFDLFQSGGIVASLLFAAHTVRRDERARRISNSIAISEQYQQIWKEVYEHPELARVLDTQADLVKDPVSTQEEMLVNMLILHLGTVYRAMKEGMFVELEGLQKDIRRFFASPIPKAVWIKTKLLQNQDFAAFIESSLK